MLLTLKCFVGVPSNAASSEMENKISLCPKDRWISWMRLLGQPEVVDAARNEGPATAVSLRREDDEGHHWIHQIGLAFATRFGELAGRTYSRHGPLKASSNFKRPAVMQWLEEEDELINHRQIWTQGWESQTQKDNLRGTSQPIVRLYHSAELIGRCHATEPSAIERHPAELHLKYQI